MLPGYDLDGAMVFEFLRNGLEKQGLVALLEEVRVEDFIIGGKDCLRIEVA